MTKKILSICCLLLLIGCTSSHPWTKISRPRLFLVSQYEVETLSEIAKKEYMFKRKKHNGFFEKLIMKKICKEVGEDIGLNIKVTIVDSKYPEAFCFANGELFISTGMIKTTMNEAELTTLVTYLAALAKFRLIDERLSFLMQKGHEKEMLDILNKKIRITPKFMNALGIMPISPKEKYRIYSFQESYMKEADLYSFYYLGKKGYTPLSIVHYWDSIPKNSGFYKLHPFTPSRNRNSKYGIQGSMKLWKKLKKHKQYGQDYKDKFKTLK